MRYGLKAMKIRHLVLAAGWATGLVFCSVSPGDDAYGDGAEPRAGVVTEANRDRIVPAGTTAVGRPGDFYLRNEQATFIIQRPGRELAMGPYGGSLVDVALAGGQDHFGELIPALAVGRTIRTDTITVIADGLAGDAIVEAKGVDATNIYYNLEAIMPEVIAHIPGGGGLLAWDPDAPLGLEITVRYTLPPDEARLTIELTFTNTNDSLTPVPFALILDSRGDSESFLPGSGFTSLLTNTHDIGQIIETLVGIGATDQAVLNNSEMAIGFLPREINGTRPPQVIGTFIPGIGGALLFGVREAVGLFSEPSFNLGPGQTGRVVFDVLAAPTGQRVLERGWDLLGRELVNVSGCVTAMDDSPVPGVRVGLTHDELGTIAFFQTGDDGCFGGRVPPGNYLAVAGATFRPPSPEVALVAPGSVHLVLASLGRIDLDIDIYDTLDAQVPTAHPCRLTLAGARQISAHPALGDGTNEDPGDPFYRLWLLRTCDEVVEAPPGRYLAIVTRGPELDRLEQIVEVSAGATTRLAGALHRVVDSRGWAASDFHVHSIYSPDSAVPAGRRVLSLAAEGLDFWAATDHDVVADFVPHIADLGLAAELTTMPGVEVTTFDTGHFNAYPLERRDQANGGAPDWAPRENGVRPTMPDLFDDIHGRGALVQVCHPRGSRMSLGAHFTRAALKWDPNTGAPYSDTTDFPVATELLRYPPDFDFFSTDFDLIEVMNGISTWNSEGMTYAGGMEEAGHDWMNFLSYGSRVVAVGNSDTHTVDNPPGTPRNMVGGHDGGITGLLTALRAGEVYVTTGPILRVELRDAGGVTAGLGDLLTPTGPEVILHLEVETADWYDVAAVDVIANAFFPDPTAGDVAPNAVPRVPLVPLPVQRPNGGRGQLATADIPLDLSVPPFDNQDSWIILRVGGGSRSLFPWLIDGGGTLDTSATTPEEFLSDRHGPLPFAFTNPIFVDMDGDGAWR